MSGPIAGVTYMRRYPATDWSAPGRPALTGANLNLAEVAGAAPLGTARYAIPAGALFLAPGGSDSAAGTISAPLATISAAIAAAPSGGTIVVRGGVYEQRVTTDITKPVTIQNYPGEVVWFDGTTEVTGWAQSGATWVKTGWTTEFDHSASYTFGSDAGGFVDTANYPMAAWPDGVYIDGARSRQVPATATPGPGQFKVDYTTDTLTIGDNPAGKEVRATINGRFAVCSTTVQWLGVGVRRYAASLPNGGMIVITSASTNSRVENCHFIDAATQALSVRGTNTVVNRNTIRRAGMVGIHSDRGVNLTLSNNIVSESNWEWFNTAPAAASTKVTRANGLKIKNNIIKDAIRCGAIWLDVSCYDFEITGNLTVNCADSPIFLELSEKGIVAGNYAYGVPTATKYGLTVNNTGATKFYNNLVTGTSSWGIGLTQDKRRNVNEGDPNIITWLVDEIEVCNNVLWSDNALFEFYALDKQTNIPADRMIQKLAGNLFSSRATAGTASRMVGWGQGDNVTVTNYSTPAALEVAKPAAAYSNAISSAGNPGQGEWTAKASTAIPLPADVAAALGVPTGTKVVGPPKPPPIENV